MQAAAINRQSHRFLSLIRHTVQFFEAKRCSSLPHSLFPGAFSPALTGPDVLIILCCSSSPEDAIRLQCFQNRASSRSKVVRHERPCRFCEFSVLNKHSIQRDMSGVPSNTVTPRVNQQVIARGYFAVRNK